MLLLLGNTRMLNVVNLRKLDDRSLCRQLAQGRTSRSHIERSFRVLAGSKVVA